MKISGRIKVVGIFGDPIAHTISPYMHNAAFEAMGLEFVYVPWRVRPDSIKDAVSAIKALEIAGVNVTIPHKEKVVPFLDWVDEEAVKIGAVNTIVNKNGKLFGYNTDGRGYWMSLFSETGFDANGKNIIVLGAGGAALAIAFSLLGKKPRSVIIANRTVDRAKSIAGEFAKLHPEIDLKASGLDISKYMADADLLINTTSSGMTEEKKPPLSIHGLSKAAIVSDIVYRPPQTPLLKEAEKAGHKVHRGLGMLIWQGALSFTLWTGLPAPVDTMRFAAVQALGV